MQTILPVIGLVLIVFQGLFHRWLCEIHPGCAGKVPFRWVLSRIELHLGSSRAEKQRRPGGLAEDGAVDRTPVCIKDTKSYDKLREKIQAFQTDSSWSLLGSSKKKRKKNSSHLISSFRIHLRAKGVERSCNNFIISQSCEARRGSLACFQASDLHFTVAKVLAAELNTAAVFWGAIVTYSTSWEPPRIHKSHAQKRRRKRRRRLRGKLLSFNLRRVQKPRRRGREWKNI